MSDTSMALARLGSNEWRLSRFRVGGVRSLGLANDYIPCDVSLDRWEADLVDGKRLIQMWSFMKRYSRFCCWEQSFT